MSFVAHGPLVILISELMELPLSIEEYLSRVHKEHDRLFPTVPLLPGMAFLALHIFFSAYFDL